LMINPADWWRGWFFYGFMVDKKQNRDYDGMYRVMCFHHQICERSD